MPKPALTKVETWTSKTASGLRQSFDEQGHRWTPGEGIPVGNLARSGHEVAWEFKPSYGDWRYGGRVMIDGKIYNVKDAVREFIKRP